MHADQVQQEVAEEVVFDDVGGVVFGKQQAGHVHLVVCDEAGRRREESA